MDAQVAKESIAILAPDQPVVHSGRRATFLHMSRGEAIIRYWGESHAVAVPPASLAPLPTRSRRLVVATRDEPTTRELNAQS
jgi:hypothetical protein